MILTGRSLCLPFPIIVQELFFVARDASIIPDISMDPVLTTFLSLDSSAALQHQYAFLQRTMSREQQSAFRLSLTGELGGSKRVTYGGVGVIALALSMLFDQVAQQVRATGSTEGGNATQRHQVKRIFGISSSSRIGWIIHSYLRLIPGIANNQEKMAETTELYDSWLKLELIDHYERMTTKKRMSSVSMQQWLAGAAVHLHMRIHQVSTVKNFPQQRSVAKREKAIGRIITGQVQNQRYPPFYSIYAAYITHNATQPPAVQSKIQVRLKSVPLGSAESLRWSYKSGLGGLVQDYTTYLRKNIQETPAPGRRKPRTRTASGLRQTNTFSISITNMTCSGNCIFNGSQVGPSIPIDRFNETTTPRSTSDVSRILKTDRSSEDSQFNVPKRSNETTAGNENRKTFNNSTGYNRDEEAGLLGLLVIEPLRNVSHNVRHHPCQSPAIQQALVTRIINAQDLERNRNFFQFAEGVFYSLVRQRDDFELKTN